MIYSREFLLLMLMSTLVVLTVADVELTADQRVDRQKRSINIGDKMENRTLNIVTLLVDPYMMIRTQTTINGEPEYVGFIPDIIHELSQRLSFQYKFYIAPDGKYGSREESGKWTGMIGECIKNENDSKQGADIAAGPLTITLKKEKSTDCVKPFQHSGLRVVMKKLSPVPRRLYIFNVFQPLKPAVWGLVLLSSAGVGLFLWLMNRYNPYECAGRHTNGLSDKDRSSTFNLAGSMWFVFTSLQWQAQVKYSVAS